MCDECDVMIHDDETLKHDHARMSDVMIHTSSCSCKDVFDECHVMIMWMRRAKVIIQGCVRKMC